MDLFPGAAECVGSGLCCLKAQCVRSVMIHGAQERCPELDWNGARYVCKLMQLPDPEGAFYRDDLYAGAGCCMPLFNDWRRDVKFRG